MINSSNNFNLGNISFDSFDGQRHSMEKKEFGSLLCCVNFCGFNFSSRSNNIHLSLNLPKVYNDDLQYRIWYQSPKCNEIMDYNICFSKNEFLDMCSEKFSKTEIVDSMFLAEKIWNISQKYIDVCDKYKTIDVDKAKNEYFAYSELHIDDKSKFIDDVFINKTFAVVKDVIAPLSMGEFNFFKGTLERTGKNLYEINSNFDFKYLESLGFEHDNPGHLGGWWLSSKRIDKVVCLQRSIMEDIQLLTYLTNKFNK